MLTLWGVDQVEATWPKAQPEPGRLPIMSFSSWNQPRLKLVPHLLRYRSPLVCLFSLSHLSPSHEGHIIIQGATRATSGPTGPIIVPRTLIQLQFVHSHARLCSCTQSFLGTRTVPSRALSSWHRLGSSRKLALKSWSLRSIRPGFESQLCHLQTVQPGPASFLCLSEAQFPGRSLERVIRKKE